MSQGEVETTAQILLTVTQTCRHSTGRGYIQSEVACFCWSSAAGFLELVHLDAHAACSDIQLADLNTSVST